MDSRQRSRGASGNPRGTASGIRTAHKRERPDGMKVAPSLTIPDELERARNAAELVVFAGAGVSMGPPANLPSFLELAREIADPPLILRPEDEEALDRYLGRAERAKINVQE